MLRFALFIESRALFTKSLLTRDDSTMLIHRGGETFMNNRNLRRLSIVVTIGLVLLTLQRTNNVLTFHVFLLNHLILNSLMSIWINGLLPSLHLSGSWDSFLSSIIDALHGKSVHVSGRILCEGTKSCRVTFFDGSIILIWHVRGLQSLLIFHVINVSVHSFSILKIFSTTFDWRLLKHAFLGSSLRLLLKEVWQLFSTSISTVRSIRLLSHTGNVHVSYILILVGRRSTSSSRWFGNGASSTNSLTSIWIGSTSFAFRFAHLIKIGHVNLGLSLLLLLWYHWFFLRFDALFWGNFT